MSSLTRRSDTTLRQCVLSMTHCVGSSEPAKLLPKGAPIVKITHRTFVSYIDRTLCQHAAIDQHDPLRGRLDTSGKRVVASTSDPKVTLPVTGQPKSGIRAP